MNYSIRQTAIFDELVDGRGNLVVDALAGSGKSFTIEHALKRLPANSRNLILAFNKHIATAMADRVSMYAEVSTCNSYGWKLCRAAYGFIKLNENKTKNTLLYEVLDIDNLSPADKAKSFKLIRPICQMVSLLKACAQVNAHNWNDIATKYGVDIPDCDDFGGVLAEVFEKCNRNKRVMDFDDQIYVPVMEGLIKGSYDFVFIDEAQDLNPIQIDFVTALGSKGRVVAVGDEHQAIYGFRGADPDAIKNIKAALQAKSLPLDTCYRCSIAVIKEAQKVVPEIKWSDKAPEGEVIQTDESKLYELLQDNDWVLCRTTAPLVAKCLRLIQKGKKAVVKGRDIGASLAELINSLGKPDQQVEGFIPVLEQYRAERLEKLKKLGREAEAMSIDDRIETIIALLEGSNTIADVLRKIETIFSDEKAPIMFCTVHRSKGLEADRIFIMRPDLLPHPKAELPWQKIQEENLKYVAITRAKRILFWVHEKPVDSGKESVKEQTNATMVLSPDSGDKSVQPESVASVETAPVCPVAPTDNGHTVPTNDSISEVHSGQETTSVEASPVAENSTVETLRPDQIVDEIDAAGFCEDGKTLPPDVRAEIKKLGFL